MDFMPFPARLCSDYNAISEFGRAQVAGRDDAVDFTGDFVPLVPLGTDAQVEWVLGATVIQRYCGQVYLSSPELLRLVGVDKALVRDTRALFATNINLPATAAPLEDGRPGQPVAVRALYLSPGSLTLQAPWPVEPGSRLLLNCEVDFLTLRAMPLRVRTRVTLRKGASLLLCDVAKMGDENLIAYSAYTARLETLAGR
ncbi:hypothetical protein LJC64_00635 [Ruminococcaceae bacterium OttesenSCG-928-A11]|nr:hypothetical protein [Ruminococcaceae bacterium OttesenSCG-928-A11]